MAAIVLTTINARYIHASLGLRRVYANLGELRAQAARGASDKGHAAGQINAVGHVLFSFWDARLQWGMDDA